jgi:hypothetical protein
MSLVVPKPVKKLRAGPDVKDARRWCGIRERLIESGGLSGKVE